MGLNNAYLQSSKNDELYTPIYAVTPLLKYIPKDKVIWCPFDKEESAFVKVFRENGYQCRSTHIDNGEDFLSYSPEFNYDIIVSNPPFSIKDEVIERCLNLAKPSILLLPVNSLQGARRFNSFIKTKVQLLIFDKRIEYVDPSLVKEREGGAALDQLTLFSMGPFYLLI